MQSEATAKLAREIRILRHNGEKWKRVCELLEIRKANGEVDTGLASLIGYSDYEPKSDNVRDRLGLPRVCVTCHRPFEQAQRSHHRAGKQHYADDFMEWWYNILGTDDRKKFIQKLFTSEKLYAKKKSSRSK